MSIKYLSCRSSTGNDITSSNTEMLVYLDACLTCLDLLLLISSPFWLSSTAWLCRPALWNTSTETDGCYFCTLIHPHDRWCERHLSLSRPGWVWRDKRAAGFLGWFVFFYAVPAFLLGHAKSTWDIVSEIQPLFLRQVISWKAFQRASLSHWSYLMSKLFIWQGCTDDVHY